MKLFSTHGQNDLSLNDESINLGALTSIKLPKSLVQNASRAFSTRRADLTLAKNLITAGVRPQAGDLVLARVSRIGHHARLELPNGRRARMFVGDEIIVTYGNRYATDQFESLVPEQIGPCHLVAGGGIASNVISKSKGVKRATDIEPLGILAAEDNTPLNVSQFALADAPTMAAPRPLVLCMVGTSMNAGKTTAAADIIRGLRSSGLNVAAAKITGTGAGGDYWHFTDAGAQEVVDFTDAGYASTYMMDTPSILNASQHLINHLFIKQPDVIILEVADGLLQRETRPLLMSDTFKNMIDGMFFATGDAMGAISGADWLQNQGYPVIGLCGMMTRSEINAAEARDATGLPVLTRAMLTDGNILTPMVYKAHQAASRIGKAI